MRLKGIGAVVLALLAAGGSTAQTDRAVPYWASIAAGEARMRTGPGRNFPAIWLYRRADLPVKVLEVYPNWRKVQDPDGAVGWMLVTLLSDQRTAIVRGGAGGGLRPLRVAPEEGAAIRLRAEPGVVGRIARCADGWCDFRVGKRGGFIETTDLWGVDPGEELE